MFRKAVQAKDMAAVNEVLAEDVVFTAKVDRLDITGCDFLTVNEEGKISEFMVMTRPLKASQALAAAMGERFPQIQAAAEAAMRD